MKQYARISTKQFRKDLRRLGKSGYDLSKLEFVINCLASDAELALQFRDHPLHGAHIGCRACHIEPDWLLLYSKDGSRLILVLMSTGTHRDVLGIE